MTTIKPDTYTDTDLEQLQLKEKHMKKRKRKERDKLKAEQGIPRRNPLAVPLRKKGHHVERVKTLYNRKAQVRAINYLLGDNHHG